MHPTKIHQYIAPITTLALEQDDSDRALNILARSILFSQNRFSLTFV